MMAKQLILAGLLFLAAGGCVEQMFTLEIPDGYTGWVVVRFGVDDCAEGRTPTRTTIKVRANGTACTSIRAYPKTVWFSRFYYVRNGKRTTELRPTAWGEGGMIWAESTETDGHEYRFFVGTEKQLNESYKARSTEWGRQHG